MIPLDLNTLSHDEKRAMAHGLIDALAAPVQQPPAGGTPFQGFTPPTLPPCNSGSFGGPAWNHMMGVLSGLCQTGQVSPLALQALMPELTQVAPRIDGVNPA